MTKQEIEDMNKPIVYLGYEIKKVEPMLGFAYQINKNGINLCYSRTEKTAKEKIKNLIENEG